MAPTPQRASAQHHDHHQHTNSHLRLRRANRRSLSGRSRDSSGGGGGPASAAAVTSSHLRPHLAPGSQSKGGNVADASKVNTVNIPSKGADAAKTTNGAPRAPGAGANPSGEVADDSSSASAAQTKARLTSSASVPDLGRAQAASKAPHTMSSKQMKAPGDAGSAGGGAGGMALPSVSAEAPAFEPQAKQTAGTAAAAGVAVKGGKEKKGKPPATAVASSSLPSDTEAEKRNAMTSAAATATAAKAASSAKSASKAHRNSNSGGADGSEMGVEMQNMSVQRSLVSMPATSAERVAAAA